MARNISDIVPQRESPTASPALASRVVEIWTRDYFAYPWILPALVVLFVLYLTVLILLGPPPSTVDGNDIILPLDGGWRILNGLVPHRDFYLSLGSITYLWAAFGLWASHHAASGLTIGFVSFAAVIAILAFLTSRARMTAAGCILFSAFILLLCTGPMPLGGNSSLDLSYAMIYNRFSYGVLSIVFVTQLLPVIRSNGRLADSRFGDIVTGASLTTLFFLKLSFCGVGAGLVLLLTLADPKNMRRLAALAWGVIPMALVMLAFLRFDILALLSDTLNTVRSRAGAIDHFGLSDLFGLSTTSLLALALSLLLAFPRRTGGRPRGWLVAGAVYTVLAEALLSRTNGLQGATFPLYTTFVFILLAEIGRELDRIPNLAQSFAAAMLVIGLSLAAPTLYVHVRSLALLAKYNTSAQLKAAGARIEGQHLQSLIFYDYENADNPAFRYENGHLYTAYLNDGIELLKKNSTAADKVTCLGFHNPFPYALLSKPPRAGSTWLAVGNNISLHTLSNERMFGDATIVMVPKLLSTHHDSDQGLVEQYTPYLLANFRLAAESEWWRLYRLGH